MAFSPLTLNNTGRVECPAGGLVSRRPFRCLALACLLAPTLAVAATQIARPPATVLDEAQTLIREGRAGDAYRLLASNEVGMAGEPLYDYLYGVAALDSGHSAQAIPAFERVLARDPASANARLELGRAYFESGDRGAARRQFSWLLSQNPPPSVRDTANAYLQLMDAPAAAPRSSGWNAGYEFGTGYDSNANSSTNNENFFGIILDPTNVEQSSPFANLALWLGYRGSVGANGSSRTTLRVGHRWNPDAEFVDQSIASLDSTLYFGSGPTVFSIGAGGYYGLLDGDAHQWGANVDLGVSRAIGEGWRASGLFRAGTLRYDDNFAGVSALDMDQLLALFSLQYAEEGGDFTVGVYAGDDDERTDGSPFGNHRIGMNFQAGLNLAQGHRLAWQLAVQELDYSDDPGFFVGFDREDRFWSTAVSYEIRDWPAAGIRLIPRISWSDNSSNIPLYDYDRFEFSLTLQQSFR